MHHMLERLAVLSHTHLYKVMSVASLEAAAESTVAITSIESPDAHHEAAGQLASQIRRLFKETRSTFFQWGSVGDEKAGGDTNTTVFHDYHDGSKHVAKNSTDGTIWW